MSDSDFFSDARSPIERVIETGVKIGWLDQAEADEAREELAGLRSSLMDLILAGEQALREYGEVGPEGDMLYGLDHWMRKDLPKARAVLDPSVKAGMSDEEHSRLAKQAFPDVHAALKDAPRRRFLYGRWADAPSEKEIGP